MTSTKRRILKGVMKDRQRVAAFRRNRKQCYKNVSLRLKEEYEATVCK